MKLRELVIVWVLWYESFLNFSPYRRNRENLKVAVDIKFNWISAHTPFHFSRTLPLSLLLFHSPNL